VELGAEVLVLVLRRDEPAEVSVDVPERPRDPLRGDLERAEDGRPDVLRSVEGTVIRLAHRDGDQRQRGEDERSEHGPAPEDIAATGGIRRGGGPLDRAGQDRRAWGA